MSKFVYGYSAALNRVMAITFHRTIEHSAIISSLNFTEVDVEGYFETKVDRIDEVAYVNIYACNQPVDDDLKTKVVNAIYQSIGM